MSILNAILQLFFPEYCENCGRAGPGLCLECLSEAPSPEPLAGGWIFSFYDYRVEKVRKAVWFLKYQNRKSVAVSFAEAMYGGIWEELSDRLFLSNFRSPLLLPVPISEKRRRERGYNQAELLCRELEKISGGVLRTETGILQKRTETEHQARITGQERRLANVLGTFFIKDSEKPKIRGRNFILIDDVVTTGATLSEAKKVLETAGARRVIAFTLAH